MSFQKSTHHSFDVDIAAKYGVEEAILIHHFQHWISINQRLKRNFHEGAYWSYQTLDEIAANFPYLTKDKVFSLLEKLCIGKSRFAKSNELEFEPVLKKGNFNKSKYDRTVWYAFCEPTISILWNHNMENAEPQSPERGTTTPIPDTKPDTKPKSVCYPDVVTPKPEAIPSKDDLKKERLQEAMKGLKLQSSLIKTSMDNKEIKVTLEEIFAKSLSQKHDWKTSEIHDAWEVLSNYIGPIRDPMAFIEGTIKNFRNKKKSEFMSKKGEKQCQNTIHTPSNEGKEKSLANVSGEHASLKSLLDAMEKN